MSAALCRLVAVPVRSIPDTPIVPALTPPILRRYCLPLKVKVPEPPPTPTMNPTLVIFMRIEPFSAYESEGELARMGTPTRRAKPNFVTRERKGLSIVASSVVRAFDRLRSAYGYQSMLGFHY